MIPDEIPSHNGQVYDKSNFKLGVYDAGYSKACLFSPKSIEEINYEHGCHKCNPIGDCKYFLSDDFYLLHYHYLSFNFMHDRRQQVLKRLGPWAYKHQKRVDNQGRQQGRIFKNYHEQLDEYNTLLAKRKKLFQ